MAQFVQLQENKAAFEEAGISIVALTYDEPALQQAFIEKNGIDYAFLSDVNAQTVIALGILNEQYAPGDGAYGIPLPGIFVVNAQRQIVGKLFLDGYKKRIDAASVLAFAKQSLE